MLQKENYIKKISCFIAYGQVSKKNYIVFSYNKKSKYVLACILALITSLLKPWELRQYFKKIQKIFCFVLVSEIMNLYVKCIPDIKRVVLL